MDALKRTQWIATSVLLSTVGILGVLLGRVAWIEKHVTDDIRNKLAIQNTAVVPITPEPGDIRFSDDTVAAGSVRMYNMFADPAFIMDPDGKLTSLSEEELAKAQALLVEALAPLVKKPADELLFQLKDNAFYPSGRARRFLWLKKEVDEDFYKRFVELRKTMHEESHDEAKLANKTKDKATRDQMLQHSRELYHALDGVGFVKSVKRIYPLGQLASSVIGVRNNYEGVDGMERQLDFLLRGKEGRMFETKDAARRTILIQDQRYTPADNGRDVWLTLDTVIQGITEEELLKAIKENAAESGTAIVMDARTGRILAIANYPTFDPAHFGSADPNSRRDRGVTDPYEPGSIFKPFVMAYAIEKGVVKPTDVFDCHFGSWTDPAGRLVRDTHGYGALTAQDVIVKSSNIGMTQVGWRLGIPALHEAVTKFGFGARTGVELPGDQKGLVRPLGVWNKGTLTSVSFGYEVAATPLQLVRAYATFANGGYLVTPRIIQAVEDQPGHSVPWADVAGAPIERQIISAKTCETMRNMMEGVYTYGTAKGARSHLYRLFGKTGTAHISSGGPAGYTDLYNSSFLCGGPMSDPRLVAIVMVHKPRGGAYYGGTVAAPAATSTLERSLMYLQVASDQVAEAPAKKTSGH